MFKKVGDAAEEDDEEDAEEAFLNKGQPTKIEGRGGLWQPGITHIDRYEISMFSIIMGTKFKFLNTLSTGTLKDLNPWKPCVLLNS